jgi:hypothetical protein
LVSFNAAERRGASRDARAYRCTDSHEAIIAQPNGYVYEWVEACVYKATSWPGIPLVPLHRLYNPDTGDHLYTTSMPEVDYALTVGYDYEGWACKAMAA